MKNIFKTAFVPIVLSCLFLFAAHCIDWVFIKWYSLFVIACSIVSVLLILINKLDFYAKLDKKVIGYEIVLFLYMVISEIITLSIAGIFNGLMCPVVSSILLMKESTHRSEKAAIILSNPINHIGIVIFAFGLEFVLTFNDSFMRF